MMSQIDPSVIHPIQQSQASPEYIAIRRQLLNELAWASNYQMLADHFGLAVLALLRTLPSLPVTLYHSPMPMIRVMGVSGLSLSHPLSGLQPDIEIE